jgi:GTPase SAR1 family protein
MKILLVGPANSGKSTVANFISADGKGSIGSGEGEKYEPTVGVRILEFDTGGRAESKMGSSTSIELWDCSGRQEFERCWPAIQDKADGVILLYVFFFFFIRPSEMNNNNNKQVQSRQSLTWCTTRVVV